MLQQDYAASQHSLDVFLSNFVKGKTIAAASMMLSRTKYGTVKAAKSNPAVDAGKLGLDVAKFAWEIIKDGRPTTSAEGAYTSVLSVKDKSYENYEYAKNGSSAVVQQRISNIFDMTLTNAKFKIDGYYGSTSPSFGGHWMPSIAFKVDEAFPAWTWNLNASAAITSAANLGSAAAPEPEVQIVATIQANGLFQSFTDTYTFLANGRTGFRKN